MNHEGMSNLAAYMGMAHSFSDPPQRIIDISATGHKANKAKKHKRKLKQASKKRNR